MIDLNFGVDYNPEKRNVFCKEMQVLLNFSYNSKKLACLNMLIGHIVIYTIIWAFLKAFRHLLHCDGILHYSIEIDECILHQNINNFSVNVRINPHSIKHIW